MSRSRRYQFAAVILLVMAVIGFGVRIYFRAPSYGNAEDPLCKMVAGRYKMRCAPLASPKTYDRGALITTSPAEKDHDAPATLPEDYLFSSACVFSSDAIKASVFREDPDVSLDFGKHKYKVDRNASAGVDLSLPRVAGLKFKAGSKISEVREVVLEADSARYFNIDSQAFLTSMKSCAIRPACIARAKAPSTDIVKRFIVARNLRYTIDLSSGASETLSNALNSDAIKVEADVHRTDTSADDLSSGQDMVVGVNYFDRAAIQALETCTAPISVLGVTGITKRLASAGTPGRPAKQSEDPDDKDELVQDLGEFASDRQPNESMEPGEADAFGGWFFHTDTQTLEFHLRNVAISGKRYINRPDPVAASRFANIYTRAHASIEVLTDLRVVNRTEETRELIAQMKYRVEHTEDKSVPSDAWFKPLIVTTSDGTERRPPSAWSTRLSNKDFVLGTIGPGEVVKVQLGRKLESTSDYANNGRIDENIKIQFGLGR
jgi:hypothetical protein